jgi:hypothetical protein
MAQTGTLEELLGAGAGWARMLGAVAGDLAGALSPLAGHGSSTACRSCSWWPVIG